MPLFDFVNISDPTDVQEDAYLGSFDDMPETLVINGKTYKYKPAYPKADNIFKVSENDASGWSSNSKISYQTPQEMKEISQFKQMKNQRYIDKERYGIGN